MTALIDFLSRTASLRNIGGRLLRCSGKSDSKKQDHRQVVCFLHEALMKHFISVFHSHSRNHRHIHNHNRSRR